MSILWYLTTEVCRSLLPLVVVGEWAEYLWLMKTLLRAYHEETLKRDLYLCGEAGEYLDTSSVGWNHDDWDSNDNEVSLHTRSGYDVSEIQPNWHFSIVYLKQIVMTGFQELLNM